MMNDFDLYVPFTVYLKCIFYAYRAAMCVCVCMCYTRAKIPFDTVLADAATSSPFRESYLCGPNIIIGDAWARLIYNRSEQSRRLLSSHAYVNFDHSYTSRVYTLGIQIKRLFYYFRNTHTHKTHTRSLALRYSTQDFFLYEVNVSELPVIHYTNEQQSRNTRLALNRLKDYPVSLEKVAAGVILVSAIIS